MTFPKGASPIASAELVLASESPRRKALLEQAGIVPARVVPAAIDESVRKGELPRAHALRLACEKALEVAKTHHAFVLAADTVVSAGRRILQKANNADQVRESLGFLSGRRHQVTTAIALLTPAAKLLTRVSVTRVSFHRLSNSEIEAYVRSGEGVGKAGGYAIQGRAEIFVKSISGSYSNVVGLPLAETVRLLAGTGYPVL